MQRQARSTSCRAAIAVLASVLVSATASAAPPVRVFVTTTDLGDLTRQVGGDRVTVSEMVRGRDDAHFAEARPSFIKLLSEADLFVQVGLDLEVGYVPVLLQNARNARVLPGAPGFVDASTAIVPLDIATSDVDRSMGDVHVAGSPHYLLDPVRGLEVASLLARKLSEQRPEDQAYFQERLGRLRQRLATALVGETLAAKYDAFKLAVLHERGALGDFLAQQGDRASLSGWLGALLPFHGTKVVDDHAMWTYFARRFGLVVVDHLEPKPGIPPTTTHLRKVIDRMKEHRIRLIFASPYYDPRHATVVSGATGARIVPLAHQTGSRDGTGDYVSMLDYNVRTIAEALAASWSGAATSVD
ncbi:MAG TPA: metal ABC transporter substrate-binding protein [Candidatus Limnocylindrales bacterium]|nr:metal ABC transporter substrate-binding protein [Candidatus Limnocylindrales bacterium]